MKWSWGRLRALFEFLTDLIMWCQQNFFVDVGQISCLFKCFIVLLQECCVFSFYIFPMFYCCANTQTVRLQGTAKWNLYFCMKKLLFKWSILLKHWNRSSHAELLESETISQKVNLGVYYIIIVHDGNVFFCIPLNKFPA